MSSNTWTADALSSELKGISGECWRVVEAQHINSTMKLVDSVEEQKRLEDLLDESKPRLDRLIHELNLHYLMFTPFRYFPVDKGSRFRRAGQRDGVFYGSEDYKTALAEKAFYTIKFYNESPETPLPENPVQHTLFKVSFGTTKGLDLTSSPINDNEQQWMDKNNYEFCQVLADEARKAGVEVIKSFSVRCLNMGKNISLLSPHAFVDKNPIETQTWQIVVKETRDKVAAIREFPNKDILEFEIL